MKIRCPMNVSETVCQGDKTKNHFMRDFMLVSNRLTFSRMYAIHDHEPTVTVVGKEPFTNVN